MGHVKSRANGKTWPAYALVLAFALPAFAGDVVKYVDPFIGTSGTGHTTPAACVPFGLVQAGPDTGNGIWDYCSGYRYGDKTICGFTQTHLNGTGASDLGDVLILPFCPGEVGVSSSSSRKDGSTPFSNSILQLQLCKKLSEVAEPGYYAVTLDGGIKVEIAAAEHSAIYRITGKDKMRLLVDCAYGIGGKNYAKTITASDVKLIGKTGLSGKNHRRQWVERDYSFVVSFNRECAAVEELPKQEGVVAPQYVFDFDVGESPLLVKVALSAEGDVEAAKRNLATEIPAWDFDAVKGAARAKWNEVLSRATIEGSDDQKKNWYTSLYHLFIQPNNIADVGAKPFYSTFSTWDTFRAAHPLYTILAPEKAAEFVDSMLEQGRRTGYLPIWTLWGKDNQCMIGTHSIPVIVDWFLKKVGENSSSSRKEEQIPLSNSNSELQLNTPTQYSNSYWLAAYAQIKDTLTKPHKGRRKERWDLLDKYGYYPFDEIKGESVSRTMECAYDDWCAGVMAEKLGFAEDAAFFFKRAENWRNVFDKSIGLARGKDAKGNWREPYNPYLLGHGGGTANDFTEGNAFQYTWHVMQNPQGLVEAMGGRESFVKKLDSLFLQPDKVEGAGCVLDVTGLIGQYVHGNEPSHHVIYFYPQVGHPEKAAERIREVFDKFYLPKPDGLCGNDDCGQMSAWFLFSAMGFYPFNTCGGEYIIGAPQVACAKLRVGSGGVREFTVVARNLSRENKYVKSVTLNGKPLTDWKIRHSDIMAGGELVFEMTAYPPSNTYPYGICAHVTMGMFGTREKAFDIAQAAGIRYVRSDFEWYRCQKEPSGEWDFSRYDEVVASAERKGVTILPILFGVPKWAQPVWEHLDEWSDFVRRVVERYGSRTPVVEIWNEENLEHFWNGKPNAANYVKTLRAAYKAVKSANPSVKVAFGGTSLVPLGYIRDTYRNGAKDCFDIMNVHPYANHWYPGHPEGRIDTDIRSLKALMAEFGDGGKPIWITEVGWPTHRRSLRDFGFFGAALKIARPGKEKWNVIIAHGETDYRAESDAYRASFPAGVTLADCTPEETERRLAAGDVDAVVFPPGEEYPAANAKSIYEFVRDGGTLIDFDGMPMWNAVGMKGANPRADRKRLRIGVDAYWMHDKTFQKWATFFATDVATANGMKLPGGKIDSERFLTDEFLAPGDRMVTLLETKDDKLVGGKRVAACVYVFDSDMKGRIAVCSARLKNHPSYTEDEQSRYIVRALGLLFAEGVEAVFPYDLRATEYVPTNREDFFGIVHSNYAPKPAYGAYRTFIECRPAFSRPIECEWRDGKGLYWPQWTKPDGTTGGMIWRESGDAAEIQVAFDGGNVAFMSMYGERLKPRQAGKNAWAVPVGPSPVYFSGGRIAGKISVKNNANERKEK